MSILSSIGRIATEYAATHARHRAARTLYLLPMDIRKDIGWPQVGDPGGPEAVNAHRPRVVIAR
ncbi:hypothetical protein SAMN03159463_01872 [Mesorhizobium sp. NFR06]|uniref:hypothetical protein n=1 Tax=Mesorhizobium sp. NFR06 TaxID=1566290 RepID=UPI0008E51099|nr:hypothetical protein [Mesorhizobium sp. NFR06]SFO43041.1 hypothetical protein SAMN03159463_01872 [Mesorhizobium sp. NFR06]